MNYRCENSVTGDFLFCNNVKEMKQFSSHEAIFYGEGQQKTCTVKAYGGNLLIKEAE